jgi:hypothetical protein
MSIVDPEISRRKLERELATWEQQANAFRQRGYLIMAREDLRIDVGFLARLPMSTGPEPLAGMVVCARIDFTNYDLWPPSVTFVDAFTGEPVVPSVGAFDFASAMHTPQGVPANLLIQPHPETGMHFLCHVGVREYHRHVEHNGDHWLLHRGGGFGTLITICDLIWRLMVRNVFGFRFEVQAMPAPFPGRGFQVALVQGDVDERAANMQMQAQAAGQLPPAPLS